MEIDEKLNAVIDRLSEDKFLIFLGTFMKKHCGMFVAQNVIYIKFFNGHDTGEFLVSDGESFSLKHTEVHQQYCRMIESRMESTLKSCGGQFKIGRASCRERV